MADSRAGPGRARRVRRRHQAGEPDLVARELAREWIEVDGELERIEDRAPRARPRPTSWLRPSAAWRRSSRRSPTSSPAESPLGAGARRPRRDRGRPRGRARPRRNRRPVGRPRRRHRPPAPGSRRRARGPASPRLRDLPRRDPGRSPPRRRRPGRPARRAARPAGGRGHAGRRCGPPPSRPPSSRRCGSRRDRIYREAADLLGCDPGPNVAELLYAHPVVPRQPHAGAGRRCWRATSILPVGVSVREAAVSWLVEQDQDLDERDECRRDIAPARP